MTDTPTPESTPAKPARKSGGALGGKVLAELQEIAAGLGISGAKKMRKGELIDAIKAARGESSPVAPQGAAPAVEAPAQTDDAPRAEQPTRSRRGRQQEPAQDQGDDATARDGGRQEQAPRERDQGRQDRGQGRDDAGQGQKDKAQRGGAERGQDRGEKTQGGQQDKGQQGRNQGDKGQNDKGQNDKAQNDKAQGDRNQGDRGPEKNQNDKNQGDRNQNDRNQGDKGQQGRGQQDRQLDDDDEGGRRRNRRGRNRGGRGNDGEPTYSDDDVLVPAAGILDILDNYAFVRTTGYLPSENDVYVSLSMVRKWGLRKGDAVTGQVRQPREGERKEKFNPMVRVDTVNGTPLEDARGRVDFDRLTPLFADERLVLETGPADLTTRVIDLVAPIGKGQRGLIVSPSQAGKTVAVQAIANAITTNNPECHLMVVLVDERPEEVTEMQRSVKGEVIASTFDRPASDHTTVAELAIERAKRLVELGHDVVVLLDSLTRLGRAYLQTASTSGRGAGGVDSAALHPAKTFFGAARNVEDGGSLTILAAALVETGSGTDEAILEEFTGAATMELHLRGDLARKRVFPAVDVAASSTRREELLLDDDELALVRTLRRLLVDLDPQAGLELVLEQLGRTSTNAETLRKVPTLPGAQRA